jgi:hypothetical protein
LNFCNPVELKDNCLKLAMKEGSFFQQEQLESSEKQKTLAKAAEQAFGQKLKIAISSAGGTRSKRGKSPSKASAAKDPQTREDPLRKAASQPSVRKLLNKFDGRVIKVRKNK